MSSVLYLQCSICALPFVNDCMLVLLLLLLLLHNKRTKWEVSTFLNFIKIGVFMATSLYPDDKTCHALESIEKSCIEKTKD